MREGTPLITTVPYAYEAFRQVHADRWESENGWTSCTRLRSMPFMTTTISEPQRMPPVVRITPNPDEPGGVINASAYRAFLLTRAGLDFSEEHYLEARGTKLEFRSRISERRWLLVLLHRMVKGILWTISILALFLRHWQKSRQLPGTGSAPKQLSAASIITSRICLMTEACPSRFRADPD